MPTPTCVLLDAGPVIALHEVGAWKQFCSRYHVVVPESVFEDEALWHSRDALTGSRETIDLRRDEENGLLQVISADASELAALALTFNAGFMDALHEGELEGLAILIHKQGFRECLFCTGDGAAIQAAIMAGLSERCSPLETLLAESGLRKQLAWAFTVKFFNHHKQRGLGNRITGFGLR